VEELNYKYDNFRKCYKSLGNVIALQEQLQIPTTTESVMQDLVTAGVIKHFELTYETAWKFLKVYLANKHNCEALSPKQVFRECEAYRVFPQNMVNELITLADARNTTTHIYNQVLAQEICGSITKHYQVFGEILKIIKIE